MSQQKLAQKLGVSIGSIRAWESSDKFSEAARKRLVNFCLQNGLRDYAAELGGSDFNARTAPGDQQGADDARLRRIAIGRAHSNDLHDAIDLVLEKGAPDLVAAVETMLILARNLLTNGTSTVVPANTGEGAAFRPSNVKTT